MDYAFFANCPKLVEGLLLAELTALGARDARATHTGVYFNATLETAYQICLWSRLANHILLLLKTIDVHDVASLQRGVASIDWSTHFSGRQSFKIDFSGLSSFIQNTQYGAQAVKDAIADQFRARTGLRPNVDLTDPDIRIHAHLYGDKLNISLDLSGDSLHKRGYRNESLGEAPLKENLAAALLIRAGFAEKSNQYPYVIDPMCGTGTLLIEAAMIATDTAPGLLRQKFGFSHWLKHDPKLWKQIREQAVLRQQQGLLRQLPDFRGYDASPRAISQARENCSRAGFADRIEFSVRELAQLVPPTHVGNQPGFLITNPPYGERLGEKEALKPLYQHLGERLRAYFPHWQVALFLGDTDLGKVMGIRAYKHYAFFNGTIACKLLLMEIIPQWFVQKREDAIVQPLEAETAPLSASATMVANRLQKNLKSLKSWLQQNHIHCYRLYDADMPEYAVAIDCYHDWAHVQEYAAPKTIDPQKANERLQHIIQAIPTVLNIPKSHIVVKQRRQQKDYSQYEKLNTKGEFFVVEEGTCKLFVNLHDYLDTGLFLDHRLMRLHLAKIVQGKRFLNLFCYTGAVTVHAAMGGARNSTSVDMSATYTAWAKRNLALNGLSETLHRVIQADCLLWLEGNTEKYDLIFLDPPTFSRSKRMTQDFDVQRDHVALIHLCMRHLTSDGVLYFSNNFRKFQLDEEALAEYSVKNISAETIDKDYVRDPKIHQCFEIRFRQ